jgi:hypothetical protein
MSNVNELLREHVTLEVDCLDRIYLNGYVPTLQVGGQLVKFLTKHLGNQIPSPALLGKRGAAFRQAVKDYAAENEIPMIKFEPGQRKDDVAARYREKFREQEGVVFIGVAQERAKSFKAHKRKKGPYVIFDWSRQSVYVNHYYFYLQDVDFGPAFIKVCSYVPYAIKVYLNGHEWVKQQLHQAGIGFETLDNGFLSCADPARLQAICDQLGP